VDELYLGVYPLLLSAGIPFFPGGFAQRDFRLVESKSYGQGFPALTYERERQASR
jgi:dihydrofolate reductase